MGEGTTETRPAVTHAPGRPREPRADAAIMAAAKALLREGGPQAVTMSAVVERSGVGRATVYRRWPSRAALVIAVVRDAVGRPPVARQVGAVASLEAGALQARESLEIPAFRQVLPLLVAGLIAPPDSGDHVSMAAALPGMTSVAAGYRASAAAEDLRDDVDAELAVDLVLGALLQRLFSTGSAPDAAATELILDVVLNGLRRRG